MFRICVLYVDEEISVQRQLSRGRMIRQHNLEVKKTGQGVFWDERVTDNDESVSFNNFYKLQKLMALFSEQLIRERYSIFKAHYGSLLKLSKMFPFRMKSSCDPTRAV